MIKLQSIARGWLARKTYSKQCTKFRYSNIDKLVRRIHQRNMIIKEILETERSYVKSLHIMIQVFPNSSKFSYQDFFIPMQRSQLLPAEDVSTIFSNIEAIVNVNKTLLEGLEKNKNLGTLFLTLVN